mmetsp:Transcript_12756/g.27626  ORF Transcript_12756/g.27626 Transcript_12756/m.27626 type:complete len:83 (+) Transcript_12756:110-358(+)|eukprot:CAMPEP_0202900404 /NCGR_PEP_ID=MMETSP1392-20130828/11513_1 /ASSEMBLY_ACC=CAM_ASM_000868 /TAXON_ID=225041 /ORGANISM="Chlamydomonas chlamydogama, Strain SAG 11-48b" /LENGTH=82 /DNA_ID=CAMNT_0049586785 /DNA_START=104 /DNA_END=352 /DNA_ORIENTATION=+
MGYAYAGDVGMAAGFAWATLVNFQKCLPWYRRPWTHAGGMLAGYVIFKAASAYEDRQLKSIINSYERKGFILPDAQKKLFGQ